MGRVRSGTNVFGLLLGGDPSLGEKKKKEEERKKERKGGNRALASPLDL